MSIYEKEGGRALCTMWGVWGHAPPDFRLSETASGAF